MSAPCCVVYYGLRFEIDEAEIESYEERTHQIIKNARKYHLKYYWGNFAEPDEKYYAFLGTEVGIFGIENSLENSITNEEINKMMNETEEKLRRAGYSEMPKLFIQWMMDA